MTSKIYSAALVGVDAVVVEVEVDISQGLHSFNIVGLPSKTVEEARDRVSSAVKNSGSSPPQKSNRRIIVNLAPADLKKQGSIYDLPIAIGYLLASNQIKSFDLKKTIFLGELSLNGQLRKVSGVLPIAIMAKKLGFTNLIIPKQNVYEASMVGGLNVFGVKSLSQLIDFLEEKIKLLPIKKIDLTNLIKKKHTLNIFSNIKGQYQPKRSLVIAAAGSHNILMKGPPGSGKSMLAKSLPSILPNMSMEEILEVTKIYSISGLLSGDEPLILNRPFRSPHHTASTVSLIGGGKWPKPGEVSLSHRGVLFLDEMAEFSKSTLESLRQPLENRIVSISRAHGRVSFPASFVLVAAINPCPCGFFGDNEKECCCSQSDILKYNKKISGPLLDRIDIQIEVPRIKYDELKSDSNVEYYKKIKLKIEGARQNQIDRFSKFERLIFFNSEMNSSEVEKICILDEEGEKILREAVGKWQLSARAYYKILRVARTIADLEGSVNILAPHLMEALSYRINS